MAKMTLKLPDDLADRLSDLQKRSDTLVKKALEEGGKVVLKQAQSNLNSVGWQRHKVMIPAPTG